MAAFQFPDPAVQTTVTNPITGSTYQWKEPPGKWVVTVKMRDVGDIIWEGENPPNPIGDYKLWYSTDTLELYFYFCDINDVCAWVPTSAPITMLEDLDEGLSKLTADVYKVNIATAENENRIARTIEYSDTAPTIHPDEEYDGEFFFNELNFKFWYDTSRLELLVLYKDPDDGAYSYAPVSIPLESLPEPGVSTEAFTYTTGRLQTAIEENYLHNLNQDTEIAKLKEKINELTEIIKGSVARYTFDNTVGTAVSRPGQISTNTGFWSSVNKFSFGTADADGTTTPSMSNGDIIETYNADEDKTNRYTITNASSAPTVVEVQYISGSLFYSLGMEVEVNIY